MKKVGSLATFLDNSPEYSHVYRDLISLSKRVFPFNSPYEGLAIIERFFLENSDIWEKVKNIDPLNRDKNWIKEEVNPLYADTLHIEINFDLSARDLAEVIKEYQRLLASEYHLGADEKNWNEMQEDLANRIWLYHQENKKIEPVVYLK